MSYFQGAAAEWNAFRMALPLLAPKLGRTNLQERRALYQSAKEGGNLHDSWLKFKKVYDGKSDADQPRTRAEFYEAYAKYLSGETELTKNVRSTWNDGLAAKNEGENPGANAIGILGDDDIVTKENPKVEDKSSFGQFQQNAATANNARAGQYVEGLGYKGLDGSFSRGPTTNVGGGRLDTQVSTTGERGDAISQGPRSVETATKTLRSKLPIAGGEEVQPTPQDNLQSDALFEAFSFVPDGYGQGENNSLHLQNKQNDSIRFGMEQLSQPRRLEDSNMPHHVQSKWLSAMPLQEIERIYVEKVGRHMLEQQTTQMEMVQPSHVLDNDYNLVPSYKHLPRVRPSPYQPVVDTMRALLPARDPAGLYMNSLPYQHSQSGTMGMRRLNVFNSLMQ